MAVYKKVKFFESMPNQVKKGKWEEKLAAQLLDKLPLVSM